MTTYEAKRADGTAVRVTVPENDATDAAADANDAARVLIDWVIDNPEAFIDPSRVLWVLRCIEDATCEAGTESPDEAPDDSAFGHDGSIAKAPPLYRP